MSPFFKADTDGSAVISVAHLSVGMHPTLHGEMKILKGW